MPPVLRSFCAILGALFLTFAFAAPVAWAQEDVTVTAPPEVLAPDIALEELALRLIPLTVEELAEVAAAWRDTVRAAADEAVAAQIAVLRGDDAARSLAAERLDARDRLFQAFRLVVDNWALKGGDAAAIEEFRAWRAAILIDDTRTADMQTLLLRAYNWTISPDGGLAVLLNIGVVVASLAALVIVARIVRRGMRRVVGRVPNLSKLLQAFVVMVVYWLVLAFGLMVVLSALGVDITPVFALIGGASFILAFAFQDTLGNLAAGLMIMINRPFDEGDFVDIGGTNGTVRAVSIVATTVTTPDNQVIVIPNGKVWGNIITNVTTSPLRRVDLTFGISYGDSIEKAQAVLERLVIAHPLTLDDPAPVIRVHALGDSSVDFIVRPWVKGGDYWTVYWDLTRQVKESFDAEGISIPFPQRDIHLHQAPQRPADAGRISEPETVSAGTAPVAKFEQ